MKNKLANWPAPSNISALSTTRLHGFSAFPYDSNNLALHVGDDSALVQKNRQQLVDLLKLPNEPVWLEQTHSTRCIIAEEESTRVADAAITRSSAHPLVILTADCIPITLCSKNGDEIAAIHAGWRGLFNGIVENTLAKMQTNTKRIMAWIGPCICQRCYEVGSEVYQVFTQKYATTQSAFIPTNGKWLANLSKLAEIILNLQGVEDVYPSNLCTFEEANELFSYRRSSQTGRIATLIWFNDKQ